MFTKGKRDQIVFFVTGQQRVVENVIRVEKGEWWHLLTEDGTEYIFPPDKILFIKTYGNQTIQQKQQEAPR